MMMREPPADSVIARAMQMRNGLHGKSMQERAPMERVLVRSLRELLNRAEEAFHAIGDLAEQLDARRAELARVEAELVATMDVLKAQEEPARVAA